MRYIICFSHRPVGHISFDIAKVSLCNSVRIWYIVEQKMLSVYVFVISFLMIPLGCKVVISPQSAWGLRWEMYVFRSFCLKCYKIKKKILIDRSVFCQMCKYIMWTGSLPSDVHFWYYLLLLICNVIAFCFALDGLIVSMDVYTNIYIVYYVFFLLWKVKLLSLLVLSPREVWDDRV